MSSRYAGTHARGDKEVAMTYETSDGMVFDRLADAMTHETGLTDRDA